jgi:hypothetical protein
VVLGRHFGYNGGMRLRAGLIVGFAAGAYVATIAQQRSRQLNQQLNQKVNRTVGRTATDKAKAAVDQGIARAKDVVANKLAGEKGLIRPVIQAPSRLAAEQRNGGQPT